MAILVMDKNGAAMIARCPICCWPLAATMEEGCVPGNCSYRPDPRAEPDEYARIQRNRQAVWRGRKSTGARRCTCAIGGYCRDHQDQCEYPPEKE